MDARRARLSECAGRRAPLGPRQFDLGARFRAHEIVRVTWGAEQRCVCAFAGSMLLGSLGPTTIGLVLVVVLAAYPSSATPFRRIQGSLPAQRYCRRSPRLSPINSADRLFFAPEMTNPPPDQDTQGGPAALFGALFALRTRGPTTWPH